MFVCLRLKITFRDFANGQVVDHKSLASLSIEDLIYIADDRVKGQDTIKANNGPEYAIAIEFLEVAYQ